MIILKNISKSYGGKAVLDNVNIEIPGSGVFGIFGASGQGKTALIRLLCGLEKPDGGEIIGSDSMNFSVVFQEDRLFPSLTALGNVSLVSDETTARRLLDLVGLHGSEDKYPDELSGGMSRRVAIARALAYGGDALILDEPFKGLEAELKEHIGKLISEYAQTKPVIIVTHDEYGKSLTKNSVILS